MNWDYDSIFDWFVIVTIGFFLWLTIDFCGLWNWLCNW